MHAKWEFVASMVNEASVSSLQLEKIIGKLKTEKYGSKILEQISKYADLDVLKEEGSKERATKRLKTKKAMVVIESSDDEDA